MFYNKKKSSPHQQLSAKKNNLFRKKFFRVKKAFAGLVLTLACLETLIDFVNHVNTATTADHTAIPVAFFQCF